MEMLATLLYAVGTLVLAFLLDVARRRRLHVPQGARLPPGPRGLPLLGNLEMLNPQYYCRKCVEWTKLYGPIFRVSVACSNMIILNDLTSIKAFLNKKEILHRPVNLITEQLDTGKALVSLNGQEWMDNRKFCMRLLKDLGYGRTSMEDHIKEESQSIVETIQQTGGSPISIRDYLFPSVVNIKSSLLFGSRYAPQDPKFKALQGLIVSWSNMLRSVLQVNVLPPWVEKLIAMNSLTTKGAFVRVIEKFFRYSSEEVKEHQRTYDENVSRDFIDGYLTKMKEHQGDPHSSFTVVNLRGIVVNFIMAGTNTLVIALHWHMLNCAMRPDEVQSKIQREIDRAVGPDRSPKWEDRHNMPFTMAVIWEMHRWQTISPVGMPRAAAEDTYFNDYFIPKGVTVIPNIWAAHMDPLLWDDPTKFDPYRFLSEDASRLLTNKLELLIPFSTGRRMCPGETLANAEIFVLLCSLLQRFRVLPEEGREFSLDSNTTPVSLLLQEKLRFLPR